MQDEINEKVVALSVKGAKLTAEMLQKAIKAMLAQAKKQQEKQLHGKQTLKQLAKQNAGLSNIEITEGYGNDNPGAKSQGMKQLMAN